MHIWPNNFVECRCSECTGPAKYIAYMHIIGVHFVYWKMIILPGDRISSNGSSWTFWLKQVQKHVFWIRTEGDTAVLMIKQLYLVQKTCFLAHFERQVRPDTLPQLANMSSQIFDKVITNSSSILVQLWAAYYHLAVDRYLKPIDVKPNLVSTVIKHIS